MQGNELASGTHFHRKGYVPGIFLKQRKRAIANDLFHSCFLLLTLKNSFDRSKGNSLHRKRRTSGLLSIRNLFQICYSGQLTFMNIRLLINQVIFIF